MTTAPVEHATITRRMLFAVAGFGIAGIGLTDADAAAAEITANEQSNLRLIGEFCKGWGDDPPDPIKLVGFMTQDCVWTSGARPPLVGHAAIAAQMQKFFVGGGRFDLKIIDSFARGPIVAHSRIDTHIQPGKTNAPGPIAGVFIFKGDKIAEWHTLSFPRA